MSGSDMAEALETVAMPATNLNPTRIALGTWAIGGWMWGGSDEAESICTIRSAVDRGINVIDTAPVYGFGGRAKWRMVEIHEANDR
jgi:aryl-alcohol dehydrogenase-like predicted oxidoreductase